jgi:glycosyltransferase involved in cell wall biosynthesis
MTLKVVVIMPVFEDWESALQVCRRIDSVFAQESSATASVLFIEDGSITTPHPCLLDWKPQALESVGILVLRRNLGHQRAIAVGLAYLAEKWTADAVVVMDSDGEDRPEDIPKLLAAMNQNGRRVAVFAERGKRLESGTFRFLYQCYRGVHRVLVGRDIRFGNFSVLPWAHVESLVTYSELWNHYAAAFLKTRLPYVRLRIDRGKRVAGKSRMKFVDLVVHGLSAWFANQEQVGTRLLILTLLSSASLFVLMGVVAAVRLFTNKGVPGWATSTVGLLLVLAAQCLIAAFMLVFSIMLNRSQSGFVPTRDYGWFVRHEYPLFTA